MSMCRLARAPALRARAHPGHALRRPDGRAPAQIHARAGEALEAAYAADLEPHLAELARHFVAAAPAGFAETALDYARRAGDRAVGQLAYEEARASTRWRCAGRRRGARCELLLALGTPSRGPGPRRRQAGVARGRAAGRASRLPRAPGPRRARLRGQVPLGLTRDDPRLVPLLEGALERWARPTAR